MSVGNFSEIVRGIAVSESSTCQIFLAHAPEDGDRVKEIYKDLSEVGYSPWMDDEDLIPGEKIHERIKTALGESDLVVACFSKRSADREGDFQKDLRLALNNVNTMPVGRIYLIPLKLDDCIIPDLRQEEYGVALRDYYSVDYWKHDGFEKLKQAIDFRCGEMGKDRHQKAQLLSPKESSLNGEISEESPNRDTDSESYSKEAYAALRKTINKSRYWLDKNPEYIHQGGMALVCRAKDKLLDRDVAVKVLSNPTKESRKNFVKTAKVALQVSDEPNFLTVYDARFYNHNSKATNSSPYAEYPYIIMQYAGDDIERGITGESLKNYIERKDRISPEQVRDITLILGRAVLNLRNQHSHHQHMNIKPSNIMIRSRPRIASEAANLFFPDNSLHEPLLSPLTWDNVSSREEILKSLVERSLSINQYCNWDYFMEDLTYLPPELFSPKLPASKVDQYMLGLLAYEMLSKKRPERLKALDINEFSVNPKGCFEKIVESLEREGVKAFVEGSEIIDREDCPESLIQAILKMISIDPDQRFDSLVAALDAIDREYELVVAKDSFRRCIQKEEFFEAFYMKFKKRLDNKSPGKFSFLFEGISEGRTRSTSSEDLSELWKRHYDKINEAILLLFAYYDQENRGDLNILSRIGKYHANIPLEERKSPGSKDLFHISEEDFDTFKEALIETVCGEEPFDEHCKNEKEKEIISECWEKVLNEGVKYMKECIATFNTRAPK